MDYVYDFIRLKLNIRYFEDNLFEISRFNLNKFWNLKMLVDWHCHVAVLCAAVDYPGLLGEARDRWPERVMRGRKFRVAADGKLGLLKPFLKFRSSEMNFGIFLLYVFLPSSFQVFKFKLVCFTFPYGCLILTKHREPMNLNQEHFCSSEVCVCPVAFVYPLFLIPHVMFLVVLIPDY